MRKKKESTVTKRMLIGEDEKIGWRMCTDSGAIIANVEFGFALLQLIWTDDDVCYRLCPITADGDTVIFDHADILVRHLPKMDFASALREVEDKIRKTYYTLFGHGPNSIIYFGGDIMISKTVEYVEEDDGPSSIIFTFETHEDSVRTVVINNTAIPESPSSAGMILVYKISVNGGNPVILNAYNLEKM